LLTLSSEQDAADDARFLLTQAQQKPDPTLPAKVIIDLVTTIMLYKFGTLNREEVEAMLSLNLQETRVYQDAKAEGREEGRVEGREEGRVEGKLEGKLELVPQCLGRGMSIAETATFLGVSVDQVEAEISKARLEQNLDEELRLENL
jgi:predicted transposase/invertase (TIGR01784 family)